MKLLNVFLKVSKYGGDEGARTPDLGIANAALSQLSYIPTNLYCFYIKGLSVGQFKTGFIMKNFSVTCCGSTSVSFMLQDCLSRVSLAVYR